MNQAMKLFTAEITCLNPISILFHLLWPTPTTVSKVTLGNQLSLVGTFSCTFLEVGFCWEPCISSLLVLYLGLLSGLEQSIYNSPLKQKNCFAFISSSIIPRGMSVSQSALGVRAKIGLFCVWRWKIVRLSLFGKTAFLNRWHRERRGKRKGFHLLPQTLSHPASDSSMSDFKPKGWY